MKKPNRLWWSYLLQKYSRKMTQFGTSIFFSQTELKKKRRKYTPKRPTTFRQKMVTGLLVTIPMFLTYLVLKLLFDVLDGPFSDLVHRFIRIGFPNVRRIPGLGLVSLILLIYTMGALASNMLGKRLLSLGEKIINRLPLVKNVYQASKQLTSAIAMQDKESFQRVVFVEYPKEHSYAIAFVTKDFVDDSGQPLVAVFLPTTPNPTSGFILLIPKSKVIATNISVEEGIKLVMSGGMVGSRHLRVKFPLPAISIAEQAELSLHSDDVRQLPTPPSDK